MLGFLRVEFNALFSKKIYVMCIYRIQTLANFFYKYQSIVYLVSFYAQINSVKAQIVVLLVMKCSNECTKL